jgi:hypothetical protein
LSAADTLTRVNSLLETGVKLASIVTEVGAFNVHVLSRHKNRCLAPLAPELPADAGSDDLRIWMQRCTDSYLTAQANGDSRSAIAACSAATRQLVALAKHQEKEKDNSVELSDNVNSWSEAEGAKFRAYVSKVTNETMAAAKEGSALFDYRWLCDLSTETRLLLRRVTENPDLFAQVRQLESNFLPQRTITPEGDNNANAND